MGEAKKPRTAKPGDLLSQWWTLGAIAADRRTTGRHMKAGWVIINSYWAKHGNGRASLRYIEKATGLDRGAIGKACRELAEWGHVTRIPHQGSRPSAYVPRWVTTASGMEMATTSSNAPSGMEMATTVVAETGPLDAASGMEMATESYLPEPAYKPASGKVDDDCAAPTAPPLAGLAPATAETAQEKLQQPTFEALWRTYDYLHGKKEAREAWKALPLDTDLAAVIEKAVAWRESWAAQGKPDAPRFTLARWLKDERYDEDAPKGFQKLEKAGKAKATAPAKAKASPPVGRAVAPPPIVTRKIRSTAVVQEGGEKTFMVDFEGGGSDAISLESNDCDRQTEGQRRFEQLTCSADMPASDVIDGTELIGRTVYVRGSRYIPAYEVRIAAEELAKIDNKPADDWSGVEQDKAA